MAVKIEPTHFTNKTYGMLLLMELMDALIEFGKKGVDIRKIWTKSRTVSGIKICRDVGFKDLGYIDSEHILFMLDLETATLQSIQRYREALKTTQLATRSSIAHTKAPSELTVDLTGERTVDSKNGRIKTNTRKRRSGSASASE